MKNDIINNTNCKIRATATREHVQLVFGNARIIVIIVPMNKRTSGCGAHVLAVMLGDHAQSAGSAHVAQMLLGELVLFIGNQTILERVVDASLGAHARPAQCADIATVDLTHHRDEVAASAIAQLRKRNLMSFGKLATSSWVTNNAANDVDFDLGLGGGSSDKF